MTVSITGHDLDRDQIVRVARDGEGVELGAAARERMRRTRATLLAALARGDRVELRGFGAFSVKHRPARAGRNPRTGAHVPVDQKSVPFFKTGKEMRERLNRDGAAEPGA